VANPLETGTEVVYFTRFDARSDGSRVEKRYEWRTPELPGVRTWVVPFTSSTPRSDERRVSEGSLLASAPDELPSVNRGRTPLQAYSRGPSAPADEASLLAHRVHARQTGRPRVRSPLKTIVRAREGGLTPRPSPPESPPCPHKGLSDTRSVREPTTLDGAGSTTRESRFPGAP